MKLTTVIVALLPALSAPAAAQVESGYLRVDGDSIWFEVAGAGPAIILIHDGVVHSPTWDGQFTVLADSFRVVRFDRRGYGRSPAASSPYSLVEDVRRLQDHLGMGPAVLIGASTGGAMAVDFALAWPDRVRALVLAGAVARGAGFTDHFRARAERNAAALERGDTAAAYRAWLEDPHIISASNAEVRRRLIAQAMPYALEHMRSPGRPVQWHADNAVTLLHTIAVPALIVTGEDDVPDMHAHAGVLDAAIPDSRRVVIGNAGHLVYAERPAEFNALVRAFLSGLER